MSIAKLRRDVERAFLTAARAREAWRLSPARWALTIRDRRKADSAQDETVERAYLLLVRAEKR